MSTFLQIPTTCCSWSLTCWIVELVPYGPGMGHNVAGCREPHVLLCSLYLLWNQQRSQSETCNSNSSLLLCIKETTKSMYPKCTGIVILSRQKRHRSTPVFTILWKWVRFLINKYISIKMKIFKLKSGHYPVWMTRGLWGVKIQNAVCPGPP